MAIYEVEAPDGRILSIEGPDGASRDDVIAQAQQLYKPEQISESSKFGRSAASLGDLAIEAIGGAAGIPAYAFGYLTNEAITGLNNLGGMTGQEPIDQQTSSERGQSWKETVTKPFQSVIGDITGTTQTPSYRKNPVRQAVEGVGEFVTQNVTEPVAKSMGVPESDIEQLLNTAGLVAGPRIVKGTKDATRAVGKTISDVAEQVPSGVINAFKSNEPVASRKIPQEVIDRMRESGDLSGLQEAMVQVAGRQVPLQGRIPEAISENVTRGYRELNTLPGALQGAADIAGLLGIGIPMQGSILKGSVPLATAFNPLRSVDLPAGQTGFAKKGGKTGYSQGDPKTKSVSDLPKSSMDMIFKDRLPTDVDLGPLVLTPRPSSGQTGKSAGPKPVAPAALLEYNPTMYASPSGYAGTNIRAVSDAEFYDKFKPQKETTEPIAPAAPSVVAKQQSDTGVDRKRVEDVISHLKAKRQAESLGIPQTLLAPLSEGIKTPPTIRQTMSESQTSKLDRIKQQLAERKPQEMTAKEEKQMQKEIGKLQTKDIVEQLKQDIMRYGSDALSRYGELKLIDSGKTAYNDSNLTRGQARALEKVGINEYPDIPGMSEAQIINLLYEQFVKSSNRVK